jgi:hypothetical protein
MWFKLDTTFTNSLGKLSELTNSWSVTRRLTNFSTTSNVTRVTKGQTYSATFTMNDGCTDPSYQVLVDNVDKTSTCTTWDGTRTLTVTYQTTETSGNIKIIATATGASSGGGEPDTPTNYTFTINPSPTSATVTLSATGYSTVSGTGSKSITVANGTNVNWSVSADGYDTQSGNYTVNSNYDMPVVLNKQGEGSGDTLSLGTLYENSKYNYDATTTPKTYTIIEDTTKAYFVYEPAPVTPNTQYRCANARASFFLDGNKTVIGERVNIKNTYTDYTFTTPENCEYMSLSFSYADISPNDVVLEKK